MGFEPTNRSLGSYCLTTWLHPQPFGNYSEGRGVCQASAKKQAVLRKNWIIRYNVIILPDFKVISRIPLIQTGER